MRFLKYTVIPLLNTHRSYTEKMKVCNSFLNIVMESALWIFRGSSFHNLAAEVPKRRFHVNVLNVLNVSILSLNNLLNR